MTNKKDFLKELEKEVNNKKIESFQEEKIIKVEKHGMTIKPVVLISIIISIIAILGLLYFFFRPQIKLPDFYNQTKDDVGKWAKQYDVDTSGIVFDEEYNFEIDEDRIISQTINPNTNVGKDVKLNFVLSLGPNPNDKVSFPNLDSMNEEEVRAWIEENKLLKTKITITYSDTVEKGNVIGYELKNIKENEFIRGSTLTIGISKGAKPADMITVEDFNDKDIAYIESWAKDKGIKLVINEIYSDNIDQGKLISQSLKADTEMKKDDILTITVSKGSAIIVPNFEIMTSEEYLSYTNNPENKTLVIVEKEVYNDDFSKKILSQSVAAGSQVDENTVVELQVSIGLPRLESDYIGSSIQSLIDWTNKLRAQNTDMYAGEWGSEAVYSKTYRKGSIISMSCENSKGELFNCSGDLPLDARFSVVLSKGIEIAISKTDLVDSASMVNFLANNKFKFSTKEVDGKVSNIYANGVLVTDNMYIREGDEIVVHVAKEQPSVAPTPSPVTP